MTVAVMDGRGALEPLTLRVGVVLPVTLRETVALGVKPREPVALPVRDADGVPMAAAGELVAVVAAACVVVGAADCIEPCDAAADILGEADEGGGRVRVADAEGLGGGVGTSGTAPPHVSMLHKLPAPRCR